MKDIPKKKRCILISDRNPNIRNLLCREMRSEGYHVMLARNGYELLDRLRSREHFDLLILDPELAGDSPGFIAEIGNLMARDISTIIHSFQDPGEFHTLLARSVIVEKDGNSIERIKQYSRELLKGESFYLDQ